MSETTSEFITPSIRYPFIGITRFDHSNRMKPVSRLAATMSCFYDVGTECANERKPYCMDFFDTAASFTLKK